MGDLFDRTVSLSTLVSGFDRVEENRGGPGTDGETVDAFCSDLDANLVRLRDDLLSGRYRPRPLLRVYVEKANGKKRPLSIPAVRDRVAMTSASLILTPVLEPHLEDCSYAYREGRSVDQAVRKIVDLRGQGYNFVVDADITSFFDEIDHDGLLAEVKKYADDPPLIALIEKWLKAEVRDGDKRFLLTKGVPQGSPISPLLSNLYLDRFDEALLGEGHKLVRFADDFVVLCKDRPAAEEALELTDQILAGLKLRLNEQKTRITDFDRGFKFLGVEFIKSFAFRPTGPEEPEAQRMPPAPRRKNKKVRKTPPVQPAAPPQETVMAEAFKKAVAERAEDHREEGEEAWEGLSAGVPSAEEEEASAGSDPILRTLYLMEQGSVLSKEDERLIVSKDDKVLREIPAIKVDQIVVFGNVRITTPALQFCLVRDTPIVLLSSRGRYYGTVESVGTERVFLQREQFVRAADPSFCLAVGREFVRAKIANTRLLLRRWDRKRGEGSLKDADASIRRIEERIGAGETLDQLRGFEGASAAAYFDAARALLDPAWGFVRRERQPPPDPVNAVLSYAYTLLFYNVYALARAEGLNPGVGFFHPMREGHPALVSDLMEEFRAVVVDAVVWPLFLNGAIGPDDFDRPAEAGLPCRIRDDARKKITRAFESKMNAGITNPITGAQADYRRLIAHQCRAMVRAVRGEEPYRAMAFR